MFIPINGLMNKGVTWIGGLTANVTTAVCRWFSNFNGTSSYAEMTDDIVLAGDFEIEIDFFVESQSTSNQSIFSDSTSAFYITVGANSNNLIVQMPTSASNAYIILSGITFGQRKKLILARSGNTFNLSIDGLSQSQNIANALPSLKINEIAARGGSNFMAGQLSNLEIWDGGDSTTGTKIINMAMDERYLNVHGEILYNNSAVVDDWYLALLGAGFINTESSSTSIIDVTFEFATTNTSTDYRFLYGRHNNDRCYLAVRNTTIYIGNGALVVDTGSVVTLGDKHIVRLYLDGADLVCELDSVEIYRDVVGYTSPVVIPFILAPVMPVNSATVPFIGNVYSAIIIDDTQTKTYNFQSLSNVIVNQADTPSANLWDGSTAVATGESSVIDTETINVLSTGVNSQVSVAETVAGQDVLVQVTVESGDLNNIICGDLTTEFTGWTNILDSFKQPIPKRFQTLTNNDLDFIVFKTNGVADVTLTNITAQTVEGYGVLNGTRNTDYEYKNNSPHAIGHDITTTQDPECSVIGDNLNFGADNLTFNNDNLTF